MKNLRNDNLLNIYINNGVAVVEINRPAKRNALNINVIKELDHAFAQLENTPEVKVIVLRGAGDKAFAAGADLTELASADTAFIFRSFMDTYFSICTRIMELTKPVIAAVNGYAYGGGCMLALSCDYVIATNDSKFGQQEINYGFFGGAAYLTSIAGKHKAAEIVMLGETFDAKEAYRIGIINQLADKDDFEEVIKKVCDKFISKSPWALNLIKKTIKLSMDSGLEPGLCYEINSIALCRQTKESEELLKQFAKK